MTPEEKKEYNRIRGKKYRESNRDKIKAKGAQYYQENRESTIGRTSKYNKENSAWYREYHSVWYRNNKDKAKSYNEKIMQKDPESRLRKWLRLGYGLSLEDYKKMKEEQQDLCKICKQPNRDKDISRLSVDHDHKTGKVRGLLCRRCNTALGLLDDRIDLFKEAILYLERASVPPPAPNADSLVPVESVQSQDVPAGLTSPEASLS
jgi:hypothetical protein